MSNVVPGVKGPPLFAIMLLTCWSTGIIPLAEYISHPNSLVQKGSEPHLSHKRHPLCACVFLSKVNEKGICEMKNINQNTFIGRLESQGAGGINRRLVQRCVSVSARGSQGHPASGQSWENITSQHHHHLHQS